VKIVQERIAIVKAELAEMAWKENNLHKLIS
jgi:hypothetical protein